MPYKLGNSFKTIKIECLNGHLIAQYRKPKAEWGERTHKLWLLPERLKKLNVEPVIINDKTLNIPAAGTIIKCSHSHCGLNIGKIAMIRGHIAIELFKNNLQKTKG